MCIKVYDILGKKVADLVDKYQAEGNYSVKFDAKDLSSGTYIYEIRTGEYKSTKKMILAK